MDKPNDLFDRDFEWDAVGRYAQDTSPGALLGVVSGRRRQGKSFLLDAACDAVGGFYYEATAGTMTDQLRHFGAILGEFTGAAGRLDFADWSEAVATVLRLGDGAPRLVVVDEFPYLVDASPQLPSVIQSAYGPRADGRRRSSTRLILCGSAKAVMRDLLSGAAPLRGRASLELVVTPFDYRTAAAFCGLDHEPALALRVFSIIGGTPAYAREFVRSDLPAGADDFDDWVVRTVLDPSMPLFREGRYLLAEDVTLEHARGGGLFHSVLAAIAAGNHTHGSIASYVERQRRDCTHPLAVLEDTGFVERRQDVLRKGRPTYHIAEPYLRFHHAVMRPQWSRLERPGAAAAVWADAQPTLRSAILGPAFEDITRAWVADYAPGEDLGGVVTQVGRTVVNDRSGRSRHEVDIVALGPRTGVGPVPVRVLGECKYGRVLGIEDLHRLQRVRDLLASKVDVSQARVLLASGTGFTAELRELARRPDILLVDTDRLYHRD